MISRVTETEWNDEWIKAGVKKLPVIDLCELPFSATELEEKFNLEFVSYGCQGLGEVFSELIKCDDEFIYCLQVYMDKSTRVQVSIKHRQYHPSLYINKICKELSIKTSDLVWQYTFEN